MKSNKLKLIIGGGVGVLAVALRYFFPVVETDVTTITTDAEVLESHNEGLLTTERHIEGTTDITIFLPPVSTN